MNTTYTPVINPNYRRQGEHIVFSVAEDGAAKVQIMKLTAQELAVFDAIDGVSTVLQLSTRFSCAMAVLSDLYEAHVIECVLQKPSKEQKKKVVIIEPHMDDAALSVGGSLMKMADRASYTLISVFTQSNYTQFSYLREFEIEFVMQRRAQESALFCRKIGARHILLNEEDQPIRTRNQRINDLSDIEETRRLAYRLFTAIEALQVDEIWLPLGLDFHADHHRTRDAGIAMLHLFKAALSQSSVYFYEDLPYASYAGQNNIDRLLKALYAQQAVQPLMVDIAHELADKQRMVHYYASQYEPEQMAELILTCAKRCSDHLKYAERVWLIDTLPQAPTLELWLPTLDVASLFGKLSRVKTLHLIYDDFFVPKDFDTFCTLFPHFTIFLSVPKQTSFFNYRFSDKVIVRTYEPQYESEKKYHQMVQHVKRAKKASEPCEHLLITCLAFRELEYEQAFGQQFMAPNLDYGCWFAALIMALKRHAERYNPALEHSD